MIIRIDHGKYLNIDLCKTIEIVYGSHWEESEKEYQTDFRLEVIFNHDDDEYTIYYDGQFVGENWISNDEKCLLADKINTEFITSVRWRYNYFDLYNFIERAREIVDNIHAKTKKNDEP